MKSEKGISTKELISFEEALSLGEESTRKLFKKYQNPGLATMLGLVGFDKCYQSASGTVLKDMEGAEYLDFLGGYGSLNLGHNPESVVKAVEAVTDRPNLMHAAVNPITAALAHNLAAVTPGKLSRTFFCNSGTEAVEGALKLARGASGKSGYVYCTNSFHGKSMGSLSVTGRDKYRTGFTPLIPHCTGVPFGDAAALEKTFKSDSDIAAFIVEPIQGEGGVVVPSEDYLPKVRELCTAYGVLLIVDEVQTGFGRTGKLFACQHQDVEPDVLCLAKSLGGGVMPCGAFITTEVLWDKAFGGMEKATRHTSTFGGNTRASAAGLAALEEILKKDLPGQAAEKGAYIMEHFAVMAEKYSLVKEVRGKGLLIGVEFVEPKSKGLANSLTKGVVGKLAHEYVGSLVAADLMIQGRIITAFTLNNPNVIRLEPPLTVSYEEIDTMLKAMDAVLKRNTSTLRVALSGLKNVINIKFNG